MIPGPKAAGADSTWPEPEQDLTHLGTIDYRDIGKGPVIVFLHLILAEASHWDRMPPLLADRFRCILPTLPMGAHRIPADHSADLSAAGLARAVTELLDHLDVHDVTLVGNDSGGAIAQVVAMNHPERLGRVVLTNCDMYDVFPPKMFSYFKLLPYIPGGISITARALKIRAFWKLPFVFRLLTNNVRREGRPLGERDAREQTGTPRCLPGNQRVRPRHHERGRSSIALDDGPWLVLVIAPLLPVAGVATGYGPALDPTYET